MALYTYSDFENEAKRLGHFDTLSKADISLAKSNPDAGMSLLKYVNDYSKETNVSKQKQLENSINQLRQNYGGYKIINGQLQLTNPTATNFNYVSPYADRIGALTDAIANRKPFSFDAESDPSAQAARKSYLRDSKRATEDAIASASAMTGGIPSSYAVMAGTQAGDYHASQFADRVQALENASYNRYINENSLKQTELNSLLERDANEKNAAYTEHMNRVNAGENVGGYSNNNSISYSNYGSSSSGGKTNNSIFDILPAPTVDEAKPSVPETPSAPTQNGTSAGNTSESGNDIASQLPEPSPSEKPQETSQPTTPEQPTSSSDLVSQAGGFSDAYSQLTKLGYSPISKAAFDRMKQQGQADGLPVAGVAKYKTYDDYLNNLLSYAMK
ncbi:MAG: hypothetical protein IKK94_08900 [Clostridia bacterium]|nr:hypothetical protein [Clostridia bacterium]